MDSCAFSESAYGVAVLIHYLSRELCCSTNVSSCFATRSDGSCRVGMGLSKSTFRESFVSELMSYVLCKQINFSAKICYRVTMVSNQMSKIGFRCVLLRPFHLSYRSPHTSLWSYSAVSDPDIWRPALWCPQARVVNLATRDSPLMAVA